MNLFFYLCLVFKVKFFLVHPKMTRLFKCENIRKQVFLIICNMKLKKTYELNILINP
jgi:hypothetical protein